MFKKQSPDGAAVLPPSKSAYQSFLIRVPQSAFFVMYLGAKIVDTTAIYNVNYGQFLLLWYRCFIRFALFAICPLVARFELIWQPWCIKNVIIKDWKKSYDPRQATILSINILYIDMYFVKNCCFEILVDLPLARNFEWDFFFNFNFTEMHFYVEL